jgi:hypothetical protein
MLQVKLDTAQVERLASLIAKAGPQIPRAMMRSVNWTGDRAYTQVTRALVAQTGAKRNIVVKRLAKKVALPGRPIMYRIIAKSPAMPLSDFTARQLRRGVSAAPWRQRRVFAHAFIAPALGGRVFVRAGAKRVMRRGRHAGKMRQPLKQLWGPVIANDLVRGQSRAAFERTVADRLVPRFEHELEALVLGRSPPAA